MRADKNGAVKSIDNSVIRGRMEESNTGSGSDEFSLRAGTQIIAKRSELRNPCECLNSPDES